MSLKQCTKCGNLKLLSEFHKYKRSSDGVRSVCKDCRRENYLSITEGNSINRRTRFYHLTDEDKSRELCSNKRVCSVCKVEKYLNNDNFSIGRNGDFIRICKDCRNISHRDYYEYTKNKPEYIAKRKRSAIKYATIHHDRRLSTYRRYHQNNRDKISKYNYNQRKNNPEKFKQQWDKWYKKNGKERNAVSNSKRRAVGCISIKSIRKVIKSNKEKYGILTCVYCKKPLDEYTIDHIVSIAHGGTNDIQNLCIACSRCNHSKGSKTVKEFEQYLKVVGV